LSKHRWRLITVLLGSLPARAWALPDYPEALQDASGAPCLPHCNVCHRDDQAGHATVDRPLGLSLERVGKLGGGGPAQVTRAVERLRAAGTDSDGDGRPDIDELSAGDDPNYSGEGLLCGPEVGCSARSAGGHPPADLGLAVLGLFLVVRRRTRRFDAR
jgi:MYXO-CTERM domain-containing protein